ncbi:MAG: ParB/RepB/Spo0J family partition protein [Bryobacteraceae bacterium]|nr:ParB/RepB/Spo0J family partition protein [Bryobacteraceae bacterium]
MNKPSDPRKALGKGLSALLPTRGAATAPAPVAAGPTKLPLDAIEPNRSQPRTVFRPEQLAELAASIRIHGIIQPLIVRSHGDRYELIAGERRWRAARIAGLAEVPVIVQDIADGNLLEVALIENIQREDLNAMETAIAFNRLAKEFGLSHEEIARRTGKDRTTITNFVRLLKLPEDVQIMLAEHRLSMGHARALLGLPTEELQRSVAEKAASQGLSVRNVEQLVQKLVEPRETKEEPEAETIDPNVKAAIEELERALGTRVRIVEKGKNRGRIEIEYYSADDLYWIYQQIVGVSRGGGAGGCGGGGSLGGR